MSDAIKQHNPFLILRPSEALLKVKQIFRNFSLSAVYYRIQRDARPLDAQRENQRTTASLPARLFVAGHEWEQALMVIGLVTPE